MNRIRRIRNLREILKDILKERIKEEGSDLLDEACIVLHTIVNNADYSVMGDGLDVVKSEGLKQIDEALGGGK